MEKNYDPKLVEDKWYKFWMDRNLFHGDSAKGGEKYCVVIPPPNVTGILHMGHALNNTVQDILVRWNRMQGKNVVWMPGTDHAGIATQNKVEQALKKEGKSRHDIGREAFLERVWKWRQEYGSTIINQLKKLGCSCDWQRERFTMDEGLSDAVAEVFVRLYDKKLIYRGNYIINWCPRCHTALSDEESTHVDTNGKLYHIRYPVTGGGHITVATTRPETLLGDTAVAVNPKDERYAELDRKSVMLPVLGRELKVIKDDFVDPKFGTGVVKVTPAHDPNDFMMGRRHNLPEINVMNGDGTMNEAAGPYKGLDRFECRRRILKDLEEAGLIEKIEDHQNAVGHCYRCDTVVEPRLSLQWFVKMKPLAAPALKVVQDGRIVFVPARWTKTYTEWMENIRDWCISRQIWWGHRIPVFYCDGCGNEWAAKGQPGKCPKCGSAKIRQDEDVLDTWFSSWLWPFSTFGWPKEGPDLKFYYPTNDLVTASEIIFFWVARMIVAGMEFMGEIPFKQVYIHGTVRDDAGRKMSKSLGNSIDPLTIIKDYSADALRFSLTMLTATGQDVYISVEKFEIGRNFGTKLWNAARFMKMHTEQEGTPKLDLKALASGKDVDFDARLLGSDDRHILAKLQQAIGECNENLGRFRFNDAALVLYEFVWHQYCDWFVEYSKDLLYGQDQARRMEVLRLMHHVFASALKLLHPFMPFVTEELWHEMGYGDAEDSIMVARWPLAVDVARLAKWGVAPAMVEYVDQKHELISAGRTLRADSNIPPAKKIDYLVKPETAAIAAQLTADLNSLKSLLRAENITIDVNLAPAKAMPSGVSKLGMVYMPLDGLIDVAAEKAKLTAQIEKLAGELQRIEGKLSNESFVGKAPKNVVDQQRARKLEIGQDMEKLKKLLQGL
ncbi:MAG: valine--tRNA ligase [Verrucomicrobia bacterium]|nr:valine--tRNA ligase [Verrucomicrobiota bacterium]